MQAIDKLLTGTTAVCAITFGLCFSVTLATPASATEVREAVRLCDKNPNCGYGSPDSDGSMLLVVKDGGGGGGGATVIHCPPKGPCSVQKKNPTGKGKETAGKSGNVAGALAKSRGAATKKGTPAVKTGLAVDKKTGIQRTKSPKPRALMATGGSAIKNGGSTQPPKTMRTAVPPSGGLLSKSGSAAGVSGANRTKQMGTKGTGSQMPDSATMQRR